LTPSLLQPLRKAGRQVFGFEPEPLGSAHASTCMHRMLVVAVVVGRVSVGQWLRGDEATFVMPTATT
jgi:hypothetical protein